MERFCTVVNDRGLRFNVRLIRKGERYGLNDCLFYAEASRGPLVEFYDARYTGKGFTPMGQFVSRYCASTLLEGHPRGRGLDLQGDVDDWKLDAVAFEMVRRELCAAGLNSEIAREPVRADRSNEPKAWRDAEDKGDPRAPFRGLK